MEVQKALLMQPFLHQPLVQLGTISISMHACVGLWSLHPKITGYRPENSLMLPGSHPKRESLVNCLHKTCFDAHPKWGWVIIMCELQCLQNTSRLLLGVKYSHRQWGVALQSVTVNFTWGVTDGERATAVVMNVMGSTELQEKQKEVVMAFTPGHGMFVALPTAYGEVNHLCYLYFMPCNKCEAL